MRLKALAQPSARVERRSTPRFCIPSVVGQDCPSRRDVASKTCQDAGHPLWPAPVGFADAGCPADLRTACVIVLYNTWRPVGLQEMPGWGGASEYETNARNCGCDRGFGVVGYCRWAKSEAHAGARWGNSAAGGGG